MPNDNRQPRSGELGANRRHGETRYCAARTEQRAPGLRFKRVVGRADQDIAHVHSAEGEARDELCGKIDQLVAGAVGEEPRNGATPTERDPHTTVGVDGEAIGL